MLTELMSKSDLIWNLCAYHACFFHPSEYLIQISVPFIPYHTDLHQIYPSFICEDPDSLFYQIRIKLVALETYL